MGSLLTPAALCIAGLGPFSQTRDAIADCEADRSRPYGLKEQVHLRRLLLRRRGVGKVDKLGPDALPVVGAQVRRDLEHGDGRFDQFDGSAGVLRGIEDRTRMVQQLGPYTVPIIRAQVPAHDSAVWAREFVRLVVCPAMPPVFPCADVATVGIVVRRYKSNHALRALISVTGSFAGPKFDAREVQTEEPLPFESTAGFGSTLLNQSSLCHGNIAHTCGDKPLANAHTKNRNSIGMLSKTVIGRGGPPYFDRTVAEKAGVEVGHSGGLLSGIGPECIGPNGLKEHAPCGRDAGLSPVRNGRVFDLAETGYSRGTAQGVDDVGVGVFGIHASIIRHALFAVKLYLTFYKGIPNRLPIRIAE